MMTAGVNVGVNVGTPGGAIIRVRLGQGTKFIVPPDGHLYLNDARLLRSETPSNARIDQEGHDKQPADPMTVSLQSQEGQGEKRRRQRKWSTCGQGGHYGVRNPGTEQSDGDVRACIDETNNPLVLLTCPSSCALGSRVCNTKWLTESQVRTVRTSLIPALDGGSYRVEEDSEIKSPGKLEAVGELFADGKLVSFLKLFNLFKGRWRLGEECALHEKWLDIFQAMLSCKAADIVEELGFWNAN